MASSDELLRVVLINRERLVKTQISLQDKNGDEVPLRETIEKLVEYISDKLGEDDNATHKQIWPLMAQSIAGGLVKLVGVGHASAMLSEELMRFALIHMMTTGFYLLKWIQKKELKICTYEEPVTQADVDMYDRINNVNTACHRGATLGYNPNDIMKEMVKRGKLRVSDLEELGYDDVVEEMKDIEVDKDEAN